MYTMISILGNILVLCCIYLSVYEIITILRFRPKDCLGNGDSVLLSSTRYVFHSGRFTLIGIFNEFIFNLCLPATVPFIHEYLTTLKDFNIFFAKIIVEVVQSLRVSSRFGRVNVEWLCLWSSEACYSMLFKFSTAAGRTFRWILV